MKRPDEHENTLGALRELPPEVSLDQVQHMVAAFPIAVGLTAWLATAKIHLNSIVMTTAGTLIVGTSAYFFSTAAPTAPAERDVPTVPTAMVEMPAPVVMLEEPAVVFERPAPKRPAPKAVAPLACTVLDEADSMLVVVQAPTDADDPVTASAAPVPRPDPVSAPAPVTVTQKAPGERTFDLRDFTGVHVGSTMDVILEIGDFQVTATGEEDALDRLDVQVQDGVLHLDHLVTGRARRNCAPVSFIVRMPLVRVLEVLGSGSVHATRLPGTAKLDLTVTGSGNILLDRVDDASALNMTIQGSGGIHLAMLERSEQVTMDIIGSGGIHLSAAHQVNELGITMHGSGSVDCGMAHVSGTSRITLLGSGNIQLGGETGRVEIALEGSGDVNAKNLRCKQGGKVHVFGTGNAYVHSDGKLELSTTGTGTIHTSGSAGLKGSRGVGSGAE